jgi:hypothetical protein
MEYDIRTMSLAEILDTGFQLLRDRFLLLVGISAVVYLPLSIGLALLGRSVDMETLAERAGEAGGGQAALAALFLVFALFFLLAVPFVLGAITSAVGGVYLGRSVRLGEALGEGLRRFLPLVWTYALFTSALLLASALAVGIAGALLLPLAVMVGFAVFVGWLYAFPVLLLLPQVVVLERRMGVSAVRRSWDLVRGVRLRAMGVAGAAGLIVAIPLTGLQLLIDVIPVFGALLWATGQAVGYAYTFATQVVLYFDIRCRKEAFDLEHLAQLVEGDAAPSPTAS